MRAEIISIGSEITSGQNLDTNCQWLSRRLSEIGFTPVYHTTVADDLQANIEVFRIAASRVDLVVATGGLGPTQDDLTREAIAAAAGVDLVEDAESLAYIESLFKKRGRVMPDRNRVQALFPRGASAVYNECGTAPGVWMPIGDSIVVAMPGVPSEMYVMFEKQVKPRLFAMGKQAGFLVQRKINAFGEGESAVEEKLLDITRRGHVPEVGITVSDAVISLRILARGETHDHIRTLVDPIEKTIVERLGDLVFGYEEEELQDVVVKLLMERNKTLSTAESVTGGLVAQRITRVPGASKHLLGGLIAYTNEVKIRELGVPTESIAKHGVVSREVAEAMAIGARKKFGTDLAVATTGLAGPATPEDEQPVGTVHVALAYEGGTSHKSFIWGGTRKEIQSRTAKIALNLVRLHLK